MNMWEILFTFATSTLMFKPFSMSKFQTVFRAIPKCEKCLYFLPKDIGTNEVGQCKKFGFISDNKTKEITYDNAIQQRLTGTCGPTGKHFLLRVGNYRD